MYLFPDLSIRKKSTIKCSIGAVLNVPLKDLLIMPEGNSGFSNATLAGTSRALNLFVGSYRGNNNTFLKCFANTFNSLARNVSPVPKGKLAVNIISLLLKPTGSGNPKSVYILLPGISRNIDPG